MSYENRINRMPFTISESLNGSLLPIDLLQLDFHSRFRGIKPQEEKIRMAITYAHSTEDRLGISDEPLLGRLEDPQQDLVSILYLDAVRVLGQENLLPDKRLSSQGERTVGEGDIIAAAEARKNMQSRLFDYLELFQQAGSGTKYDALEAVMYDAQCLLMDKTDLPGYEATLVRRMLSGILAEHKVIDALQNGGYHFARYGTPEEDVNGGADIVLDADKLGTLVTLSLQVKADSSQGHTFTIGEDRKGNPVVRVPMNRRLDQFSLGAADSKRLLKTVDRKVNNLTAFQERWASRVR